MTARTETVKALSGFDEEAIPPRLERNTRYNAQIPGQHIVCSVCQQTIPIGPGESGLSNASRRKQGLIFVTLRRRPCEYGDVLAKECRPFGTRGESPLALGREVESPVDIGHRLAGPDIQHTEPAF